VFFATQLYLLLAEIDIGLLQGHPGAVDLGQGVLDRTYGRDGRDVQRDLHELAVALVEVAGVTHDRRHLLIDVLQHDRIFGFLADQCGVDVGQDEIV